MFIATQRLLIGLIAGGLFLTAQPAQAQDQITTVRVGDKETRVAIEQGTTDPFYRVYTTDGQISSDSGIQMFDRPVLKTGEWAAAWDKIGPTGRQVIEALFQVDGISNAYLDVKKVTIQIGMAFTWAQIEPRILQILAQAVLVGKVDKKPQPTTAAVKLVITPGPVKRITVFHSNRSLVDCQIMTLEAPTFSPVGGPLATALGELGPLGERLIKRLKTLPGLDSISISPYEVHIELDAVHPWSQATRNAVLNMIRDTIAETSNQSSPKPAPKPRSNEAPTTARPTSKA